MLKGSCAIPFGWLVVKLSSQWRIFFIFFRWYDCCDGQLQYRTWEDICLALSPKPVLLHLKHSRPTKWSGRDLLFDDITIIMCGSNTIVKGLTKNDQ